MAEPFYFVAYSTVDASDRALTLVDLLAAGPPSISTWLDQRKLQPGIDRYAQVLQALKDCQGVLFLMTRDSTDPSCPCTQEWIRALKYKKPVVPLLFDADAELPFQLEPRVAIRFAGSFDAGLAQLREHVRWRATPQGQLHTLQERMKDALRDASGAVPADKARIDDELAQLRQQIDTLQASIADPDAARRRTQQSIERGLERERQPETPVTAKVVMRFINRPPAVPPSYFQDRHLETSLIGAFLRNDDARLMTVVGRGGTGKTALVCRLLRAVEGGHLPDDGGDLVADGIVYLSARSGHPVNFPNLFFDLCRLLPEATTRRLDALYKDPSQTPQAQMEALLTAFPSGRYIVLLDNFEDVVNAQTQEIQDVDLDQALRTALAAPPHGVKFLITTRVAPISLMRTEPGRQDTVPLDEGLKSPYAENVLKAMDPLGTLGLVLPDAPLADAREVTRGFPRALEALVGILRTDRNTDLRGLLEDVRRLGSRAEDVVRDLVGEAFNRLDPLAQEVMQALAVYGVPVPAVAVDYLLQQYRVDADSSRTLARLVNMHFVRGGAGRFYLHQVDRDFALSRIAGGEPDDRLVDRPPFTRFALRHRAAQYFKQTRKPREAWKSLDDVAPQLTEFDLRLAGADFDAAALVLIEIDSDYLSLWGHYRVLAERYEQVHGQLSDLIAASRVANGLGAAYTRLGQYSKAVDCFETYRRIAQKRKDARDECVALMGLSWAYADAGDLSRSLQLNEQALAAARGLGDQGLEAITRGNLANRYGDLGRLDEAIDMYRTAVRMHGELGYPEPECRDTYNLATALYKRGDYGEARQAAARARDQAVGLAYRLLESAARGQLADLMRLENQLEAATSEFELAIELADAASAVQMQQVARHGLAWTRLAAGDLRAARVAAEQAAGYRYPRSHAESFLLIGFVALRRSDRDGAGRAFDSALSNLAVHADATDRSEPAAYDRALAWSGLVLARDAGLATRAAQAFAHARHVCSARGVVEQADWKLLMLEPIDAAGVLRPVRDALLGRP